MKVCIVFPVFPPSIDGIGDYTSKIAGSMSGEAEVYVLTGKGPHELPDGVQAVEVFHDDPRQSAERLVQSVDQIKPDWVLVQYNPFSYGKWGYNPHLPRAIGRIGQLTGVKVATMVHEPCVPPESLRFRAMRLWQLKQLRSLINSSTLIFFSITAWTAEYRQRYPQKRIVHLPIGSNMPLLAGGRRDVREKYGISDETVLFGLFGSGHPNRLFHFVREAIDTLRRDDFEAPLLYVGGSSDKLQSVFGDSSFHNGGKLPAEEVSQHLNAMDVYLCPFGKGVSSRRGSFMAGIQHGLPCVTTTGSQTDEFLFAYNEQAFLASPDSSVGDFCQNVRRVMQDEALRHRIGARGHAMYTERFDWGMIASAALNAMADRE